MAGDAEEAIELLDEESPELIVLDLKLPGSPGTDVIGHLRDEDRATESAIVVYTGLDLDREELAELRGFADVVTKSRVSSEEFEELLLAVLNRLRSSSGPPVS